MFYNESYQTLTVSKYPEDDELFLYTLRYDLWNYLLG
jgi:hypothetical protein